jgi:hypothetical protein
VSSWPQQRGERFVSLTTPPNLWARAWPYLVLALALFGAGYICGHLGRGPPF